MLHTTNPLSAIEFLSAAAEALKGLMKLCTLLNQQFLAHILHKGSLNNIPCSSFLLLCYNTLCLLKEALWLVSPYTQTPLKHYDLSLHTHKPRGAEALWLVSPYTQTPLKHYDLSLHTHKPRWSIMTCLSIHTNPSEALWLVSPYTQTLLKALWLVSPYTTNPAEALWLVSPYTQTPLKHYDLPLHTHKPLWVPVW